MSRRSNHCGSPDGRVGREREAVRGHLGCEGAVSLDALVVLPGHRNLVLGRQRFASGWRLLTEGRVVLRARLLAAVVTVVVTIVAIARFRHAEPPGSARSAWLP